MAIPLNGDRNTTDKSKDTTTGKPQRVVSPADDNRSQYRVGKNAGTPLEGTLTCGDGKEATGECLDLSIAGAAIAVPRTKELDIREGSKVRIRVMHLGRPKGIETQAEVVSVSMVGTLVRYGLKFTDVADVVRQTDSFFARWFNRRQSTRVMPDFSTKITATVQWSSGSLQTRVYDISTGGLGLLAPVDKVEGLTEKAMVEVTLSLPDLAQPVACRARITAMKAFKKNVLIGLQYEKNGGIERYLTALQRYVQDRQASIARFNEAMSQLPKRAG